MFSTFGTEERHGYAVEFSPYMPQRIACSTSQHFGIAGVGTVFFFDVTPTGETVLVKAFDWQNGLFDVSWSESNENVAVTGSGDGSLQLWNIMHPSVKGPVKIWKEHTKEVYGVHWSQTRGTNFVLSASWDKTIKLWDATRDASLATFPGHGYVVYSAIWAPLVPGCFASTSGDHTLRVWDIRKQYMPQMVISAHDSEVITCDWCKYNQNLVITGGVDGLIKGWDLRNSHKPVFELKGHEYAIRRLKCSPFQGTTLATCSYDFTVRIWDIMNPAPVETIAHHTEFVCGIDFNLHIPGQIADCAWDQTVKVYSPKSLMPSQNVPP